MGSRTSGFKYRLAQPAEAGKLLLRAGSDNANRRHQGYCFRRKAEASGDLERRPFMLTYASKTGVEAEP